jgi:D-alanyl-D-alanine dipeptidase
VNRQTVRAIVAAISLLLLQRSHTSAAEPELVDIRSVDPSIVVELRYATSRNIAQRAIYSRDMPALIRPHVAAQLAQAQTLLRLGGHGLKIWDAYRPQTAQEQLWKITPNNDYVANPTGVGSLHTWGVAVDATLVDRQGREVSMPTDFDDFTPAAMLRYTGGDALVRRHLYSLQAAMDKAGFYGTRTEWWHFISRQWAFYEAVPQLPVVANAAAAPQPARAIPVTPERAGAGVPVMRNSPPPNADIPAARPSRRSR